MNRIQLMRNPPRTAKNGFGRRTGIPAKSARVLAGPHRRLKSARGRARSNSTPGRRVLLERGRPRPLARRPRAFEKQQPARIFVRAENR